MRLDKYLCDCKLGSRSEVKNLIKKGQITVNGNIVKDPSFSFDENNAKVSYLNKELSYAKYHYYVLNKPAGYVCSREEKDGKPVFDLLPEDYKNLQAVGRLDKETEGLLLFTNDGDFNHKLLSSKYHVEKTYEVHTEKPVTEDDLKKLSEGILLDDGPTLPAKAVFLKDDKIISLTLTEGRFHQVKRMLQATCNKVIYLKRIRFGNLDLNKLNLNPGEGINVCKEDI